MTSLIKSLALFCVFIASPAFSGAFEPRPINHNTVAPAPSTTANWDGFYFGGMSGFSSGENAYYARRTDIGAVNTVQIEGFLVGGFLGRNFQFNNLVFGLELGYTPHSVSSEIGLAAGYRYTHFLDYRARIGLAFENTLIFGSLGYTSAGWSGENEDTFLYGNSYGIGIDQKIGEQLFVGLEYIYRDIVSPDFTSDYLAGVHMKSSQSAIQFRFGIFF
ncbi:MAG: porin family protein [Rhodobacteraceae bacterium]|nr:porin family protein [Paracoccaceae bacterium]